MIDASLTPARDLAARASKPYPNDSAEYRKAREDLLAAEIELRRQAEAVAARRRALPAGGVVPQDYAFTAEDGSTVRLSEMFEGGDTLVIYIWMYGPQRKRPCPMCTSTLGALDGEAADIAQQVPLAIVGRSPIERQLAFKAERGWRNLKLFATQGDAFTLDYRGQNADGSEDWAGFHVFTKDADGTIRHFYGDEMDDTTADPGQDPRGPVDIQPMWTIFDMTPKGRDPKWYPKLEYGGA